MLVQSLNDWSDASGKDYVCYQEIWIPQTV